MRRSLIIFIIILLAATSGTVLAAASIKSARKNIVYTQSKASGDPKAADGLSFGFEAELLDGEVPGRPAWINHVEFSNGETHITTEAVDLNGEPEKTPLIRYSLFTPTPIEIEDDRFISDPDAKLSELFEYYPLSIRVQTPDNNEMRISSKVHGSEEITTFYSRYPIKNIEKLEDFFCIPVLKNEKQKPTNSTYMPENNEESFNFHSRALTGENVFYLYFSNKTSTGNTIDSSLIPGGYGLYSLPFDLQNETELYYSDGEWVSDGSCTLLTDRMKNIFPLSSDTTIESVEYLDNESRLFIVTSLNGAYTATVFDPKSEEIIQTIPLDDFDMEYFTPEAAFFNDGFNFEYAEFTDDLIIYQTSETSYGTLTRNSSGMFEKQFSMDFKKPMYFHSLRRDTLFIKDDGRIAVIRQNETPMNDFYEVNWGCGFEIYVFTPNGLEYNAVWESSLDKFRSNLFSDHSGDLFPIWWDFLPTGQ